MNFAEWIVIRRIVRGDFRVTSDFIGNRKGDARRRRGNQKHHDEAAGQRQNDREGSRFSLRTAPPMRTSPWGVRPISIVIGLGRAKSRLAFRAGDPGPIFRRRNLNPRVALRAFQSHVTSPVRSDHVSPVITRWTS